MFTLRTLFVMVTLGAVGTGAVIYRSPVVSSIVVSLALCALAVFALRIWSRPHERRFWLPAAALGWCYVLLAFATPLGIKSHLITSRLIFEGWVKYVWSGQHEMFEHEGFKEEMYDQLIAKDKAVWASSGRTATVYELWRIYAMLQALISVAIGILGGAVMWVSPTARGQSRHVPPAGEW